jgi:signal transduction histidine kinase
MHQAVLAGNAPVDGFEITFMRKNGERFNALVYEAKLIDGNGQHTGWMASVLDVTERKRAEELARQQQEQLQFTSRLVTMGEMASTLAHELNQPLAAIASYNTGCLNLLERPDCQPREIRPALEKIGVQAQRAGKIIRRVHDFVRKSEPKRAPCQLAEIIEDCIGFVEPDARKHHVRIECQLPPLPPIPADRLMLEQVLLNLIRNGMEAMSGTPEAHRRLQIGISLTDTELKQATALAKEAVGFNKDRGDTVNVANVAFAPREQELIPDTPLWKDPWLIATAKDIGKWLLFVFLAWLLWTRAFKPLFEMLAASAHRVEEEQEAAASAAGASSVGHGASPGRSYENKLQQARDGQDPRWPA